MGKTVLIAAAAYNWAECHRMADIGVNLQAYGCKVYSLGTGQYDYLLKGNGFTHVFIDYDEAWYTPDRIEKLMDMDRYGNNYCTEEQLTVMTQKEVDLLETIKPDFVVTGYRTTLTLSCKMVRIPLVWVLSAVVSPLYYKAGYATMPDKTSVGYVDSIKDEKLKNAYYSKLALKFTRTSQIWNIVANKKNIKPFSNDIEVHEGDYNLMSDCEELFEGIGKIPPNYDFCGPLLNSEEIKMPESVISHHQVKGNKKIFVTMGSSGEKEVFIRILEELKKTEADIFVATTSILSKEDIESFPDNFIFQEKYPHIKMAEWVDLSIIHGGQGTLYASLIAGKPIIGIPRFCEQRYNLENVERAGCCITLKEKDLGTGKLVKSINDVFADKTYYENALKVMNIVRPYYESKEKNAGAVAAKKIMGFFCKESANKNACLK